MGSETSSQQLAEINQRLTSLEKKVVPVNLGLTNFMLVVAAIALCTIAYVQVQQYSSGLAQAELLRSTSLSVGNQLNFIESSYSEVVYDDPESKGIYHQMFRVAEFQLEVLKLLAFQNQLILASQAKDTEIMRQTALGQFGGNWD